MTRRFAAILIFVVGCGKGGDKPGEPGAGGDDEQADVHARKAKTVEAVTNIRKLFNGARAYYEEERSARGSTLPIAKQFPSTPAISTAPAPGACCGAPDRRCAANPNLWADPSWQALLFSMDAPHYYAYTYISSGEDSTAQFTVRANGDLDCDGVFSTFEMVGSIQADGTVTGSAGLFKDQELE